MPSFACSVLCPIRFFLFFICDFTAELINLIVENSLPQRCFRLKKVKYEILILWSGSRYFLEVWN